MRIARKLILLALTAIAAMAFAAGTASAQEVPGSIDFRNEPAGTVCNPCEVRVEGEGHIVALPSGVRVSQCTDTFHMRLYGINGATPARGELEWTGQNDNPPPNCTPTNCTFPENHWPITNLGEIADGVAHMTRRFCLLAGGSTLHCNAEDRIAENPANHSYMFSTTAICAGGARRWEGEWNTDTTNVELLHLV